MWRRVVLPVIVVGLSWLTMSVATTCYVLWLDASYQRMFDENVASANAAGQVQEEVWHLHAEWLSQADAGRDWPPRLAAFDRAIEEQLTSLRTSSTTSQEQLLAASLGALTRRYRREIARELEPAAGGGSPQGDARLFALAAEVSQVADRIREVNDVLSQASTTHRISVRNYVLWGRTLTSVLVSALGIALGWWTAIRLKQSVTQIQVSLHDPLLGGSGNLGTVQVRASGDELFSIQRQVEVVIDRLRRTSEELQAARQEMVRSERLAAIGRLAAGVAHELRNPLTSVKLLLQHAAGRGGDAVIAQQRLGLILDEIERMEATIQGLLDFSRPARPQRQIHDLRQTLERALHLVEARAEKQQVATELDLGPAPLMLDGDPQQLHQVFVNLLINAIEAMPQGGQLSVCRGAAAADWIAVEVRDTGVGIPAALLPRLFEPFVSTKERGTGLGLAVSRRIVEEHGGTIEVQAQAPQGTVFKVTLPAARAAEPAVALAGAVV